MLCDQASYGVFMFIADYFDVPVRGKAASTIRNEELIVHLVKKEKNKFRART